MEATFVETGCVITHEGQSFESGGAFLCDCTDGYRRGVVYAKPNDDVLFKNQGCRGVVTDWHGNKVADAILGPVYRGGFGARMRAVSFTLDGVTYMGRYGCDWADAVRVRSTVKV